VKIKPVAEITSTDPVDVKTEKKPFTDHAHGTEWMLLFVMFVMAMGKNRPIAKPAGAVTSTRAISLMIIGALRSFKKIASQKNKSVRKYPERKHIMRRSEIFLKIFPVLLRSGLLLNLKLIVFSLDLENSGDK